jgi:hypothetical protein
VKSTEIPEPLTAELVKYCCTHREQYIRDSLEPRDRDRFDEAIEEFDCLVGMVEDGTVSTMEELYEYGMDYREAVASPSPTPLTYTDRESIMGLALESGFEKNWAVVQGDGDTDELAAGNQALPLLYPYYRAIQILPAELNQLLQTELTGEGGRLKNYLA